MFGFHCCVEIKLIMPQILQIKPSQAWLLLRVWSGVGEVALADVGGAAVVEGSAGMGNNKTTKQTKKQKAN